MSGPHTLVVYRAGPRADAALRRLARVSSERGGRLTVLALALRESQSRRCCDIRSGLWNEVCTGLARNDLARAAMAVEDQDDVELDVLHFAGGHAVDAVLQEALAREADEIVLADPRTSGLGWLQRRRLRRRSSE